ncbi:MAG: phospholipase D-like domain-containing protein [Methanothrix sp.]|nr:phospholipase D-like domain-containing protein [Methanothrix sp.]
MLKWKERALELEEELKRVKQTQDYASAERLQFLEDYIAKSQKNSNILFLGTFSSLGRHAFEDELRRMLEDAKFEIVIVSPWIKRQTWNRMKGPLRKFSRRGGKLRVFMRGSESDYSLGLSDNLLEEISDLGGDLALVALLHAKIYMVDRREAIVTSANLTKGGTEANYEGGIWVNDPVVLKEICEFVDDIRQIGAR